MHNDLQRQTTTIQQSPESSPTHRPRRTLRFIVWATIILMSAAAALGGIAYWSIRSNLPDAATLRDIDLQVPLQVYSREGLLMASYGSKRRLPVPIDEIPQRVQQAFLAAEDDRFFEHPGVDYQGLLRAFIELVRTGEKRQGGSTITMQVARNFFLNREKTFTRKFKEIVLALQIERELSKAEILELYFNKIYLGQRAYGVGAAAQIYYGKSLAELSLPEIAMIAGLPKAPSSYNPISNAKLARNRRNYVLRRLLDLEYISTATYNEAVAAELSAELHKDNIELEAPYAGEMVRARLVERFGERAYTAGYEVFTTIDARMQRAATAAVRNNLLAYDRRHGWRGPEASVSADVLATAQTQQRALTDFSRVGGLLPGLVVATQAEQASVRLAAGHLIQLTLADVKWARKQLARNKRGAVPQQMRDVFAVGDVIRVRRQANEDRWQLVQIPEASGALLALEPNDGAIRALVGGFDFFLSKFNRATQAERQPGSNFKPFIYSAALAKGFTPATVINDAPRVFENKGIRTDWRPHNYSSKFFGPTRMREALTKSRNLVSIRLLDATGIQFTLNHLQRFGFAAESLPRDLTLALGSATVTPMAVARGYTVLANGGYLTEPYLIERIVDGDGQPIFLADPPTVCSDCQTSQTDPQRYANGRRTAQRTLPATNAYQIVSMLQDVIRHGTGRRALQLGRDDLGGKTGTTNQQRDAWFSGFNRDLVATTWVGFDKMASLGKRETGARAALPAWIEFMRVALDGQPEQILSTPSELVTVRIDPESGLRAAKTNSQAIFETFRKDHVPPWETSLPSSGQAAGHAEIPEQLF